MFCSNIDFLQGLEKNSFSSLFSVLQFVLAALGSDLASLSPLDISVSLPISQTKTWLLRTWMQ